MAFQSPEVGQLPVLKLRRLEVELVVPLDLQMEAVIIQILLEMEVVVLPGLQEVMEDFQVPQEVVVVVRQEVAMVELRLRPLDLSYNQ